MSFMGKLGHILATVGPIAASFIPGGGAVAQASKLARIGKFAGNLAPVLGNMAKSQAGARQQTAGNNMAMDRLAMDKYRTDLAAPETMRRGAVRSSMTANASPVRMERDPSGRMSVTGGYANPNLINADTRAMSEDMTHQALLKQLTHQGAPTPTPLPREGKFDKFLGGAAGVTSVLGALQPKDEEVVPNGGYD